MIDPRDVTACLVTRGNVDIRPVLDSLPFGNGVVWDNSQATQDLAVYGRYAAVAKAETEIVYVQDDDCILATEAFETLLAAYEPGHVVCNMPERFRPHYPDSALVGFGALFEPHLAREAFLRLLNSGVQGWSTKGLMHDPHFQRTCDVAFTALTPRILVDAPYSDREFASAPDRMWKQPGHVGERQRMLELARRVRDEVAA